MAYIFLDFDGTLAFHGKISNENLRALYAAREAGHKLVLNTGRGRGFVPQSCLDAFPFDGLICGSVYLFYEGREIYSLAMEKEAVTAIVRDAVSRKIPFVMEGTEHAYFYIAALKGPGTYLSDDGIEDFLASPAAGKIAKISFLVPELPEDFKTPTLTRIPFPTYVEGVLNGHDKSSPMRVLSEKFGIPREEMTAIGDSLNDAAMLAYAGKSAVIGHAPAPLDAYATYRTTGEEDGVAEALSVLHGIPFLRK